MKSANMKDALATSRSTCPGLPEDTYRFAEYLSGRINENVSPFGMTLEFVYARSDIEAGRCRIGAEELPDYVAENKEGILENAKYILQIIDGNANKGYASAVRDMCKDMLNWEVPIRKAKSDSAGKAEQYPPYIRSAVEWWVSAIVNQESAVSSCNLPFALAKRINAEMIDAFRSALSNRLMSEMNKANMVSLHVDYQPDQLLREAWKASGVGDSCTFFIFPTRVSMFICHETVKIRDGGVMKTIWEAD